MNQVTDSGEGHVAGISQDARPVARTAPPAELPDWVRNAARYNPDPLKAARDLRPVIEAGAAEGARLGYLPDSVVRPMAEAGMWGLRVPREFGGSEVDPRTYIDVIAELSYADGSAGWTVMASNFGGGGGLGLGPSAVERIYGGNEGIMTAAQISKLGHAERVEGGYQASGAFQFGSGSHYASWFSGAFVVHQDGEPVLRENGKPQILMLTTDRKHVRLLGNWDVMGLAATGSYDWEFQEQFVPDDWVTGLPGRRKVGGPTHAIGVSIGHVAWALGVGERALDEIFALAKRKQRFQRTTLIDQSTFQLEYGRHRSAMEAARALIYKVFDDWHEAARQGPVPIEVRAAARRASCWATEVAHQAAQFMMFSSGSDGVRNAGGDNRIQRIFRDLQTGSTHRHIDQNTLVDCTQVALGVADPDLEL
jgi:alkylation response protein AidB-like acyl-CoA dehydrogenase